MPYRRFTSGCAKKTGNHPHHEDTMARHRKAIVALFILAGLGAMASPTEIHSSMRSEDRWAPAHIDGLPQEVRQSLVRFRQVCGPPAAEHYFALYLEGGETRQKFITLHYEHFRCNRRELVCPQGGCLHQVFASDGGRYRLILSVQASEVEMKLINHRPALEIACDERKSNCPRILLWNGGRFVAMRR